MTVKFGIALALGAVTLLSACDELTVPGSGITSEMRKDYLDAVASIGCQLRDDRQYSAVEFQAGLTREQTVALTQQYLARGKATRGDDNVVTITTGPCAA
ncbi:MAG: hypothetical protein OIF47_05305 [Marinibacterium sp.]|nr:hypothetical protein [Marinibacterium sp.]